MGFLSAGDDKSQKDDTMDEQRKHAILFAATLLSARKLLDWMEIGKPTMAKQLWVDKAVEEAAFILERIDQRWPGVTVHEKTG